MKAKLFALVAIFALFAASCSREILQDLGSEEISVSFNIDAGNSIATKAFSDGTTATQLYYAVYLSGTEAVTRIKEQCGTKTMDNLKSTVTLTLVKGKKYDIIFWAQSSTAPYSFDMDAQEVTVDYKEIKANNENLDAFYFTKKDYLVEGPRAEDVKLQRPFAQINVGTSDEKIAAQSGVKIETSSIKMTLKNTLNLYSGVVGGEGQEITFGAATIPSGENDILRLKDNSEYGYMAMNYILVEGLEKTTLDLEFTLYAKDGLSFPYKLASVPVQRNYRTNIYGDLLTNPTEWNVEIAPAFDGEHNHNLYTVSTAEELANALVNGQSVVLNNDITMAKPIVTEKSSTIDLNGKKLEYTGFDEDNLVGTVSAILVKNGATLNVEGTGSINTNGYAFAISSNGGGTINLNGDINYNSTNSSIVNVNKGTLNVYAGTFSINDSNKSYVLNCIDIYYKEEEARINVYGGTFEGFNPADCEAEGPNTNFVPAGYASVEVETDTWKVVAQEGSIPVANNEELESLIEYAAQTNPGEDITVELSEGKYTIPAEAKGKTIAFVGTGNPANTSIACDSESGNGNFNGSEVTFENLTIVSDGATYNGFTHVKGATYKNCIIDNQLTMYNDGDESLVFENCTFNVTGDSYNFWSWGASVIFTNCTFNCDGKAALVYGGTPESTVTFNSCIFNDNGEISGKAAIETGDDYNSKYNININGCIVNGFDVTTPKKDLGGDNLGTNVWGNKDRMPKDRLNVFIDAKEVY